MQKLSTRCKHIAFTLLVVLVGIMSAATFIEHRQGTDYVTEHIYYTWWFAALWGVMTVCALVWLFRAKGLRTKVQIRHNFHIWALHLSLVIILAGAAISALTSESGLIHLRLHTPEKAYISEVDKTTLVKLPFTIELTRFEIDYHNGTHTASNYISHVNIDGHNHTISMNKVLSEGRYRLYQMSYDSDNQGSILMVRSDPWGQPVTYAGYALLTLSLILLLFAPDGGFRRAWKGMKKLSMCLILFALSAQNLSAQDLTAARTLSVEAADSFGRLYVSYGGRICPVQTLAQDFCRKIYGKPSYKNYSAEQVMTGWLFWPEDWNEEPIIQVKNRALRNRLNLKSESSFNDIFRNGYCLGPLLNGQDKLSQAALELDSHIQLIYSLRNGDLFKLFPVSGDRIYWTTPTAQLDSTKMDMLAKHFVQNIFVKMFEDAANNDEASVLYSIEGIAKFQHKFGGDTLPTAQSVKAERLYNSVELPTWLYRINLVIGLLLFFAGLRKQGIPKGLITASGILGVLALVALTVYMGLRTYISGRLPLGNGYETMLTAAWLSLIFGIWLFAKSRVMPILLCATFLASGFFLLVASLSQSSAQISQLVPVLSSPLLSLHVSIIMLAYALLSFTFILSVAYFFRPAQAELSLATSQVILYPAISLLGIGIFVGAVWGNQSWGRYWGWDPKEVWALITLLVYILPLHAQSIPLFRKPRVYHIYMLLAFSTVLMTYFGVNFFLGGMHSYAG